MILKFQNKKPIKINYITHTTFYINIYLFIFPLEPICQVTLTSGFHCCLLNTTEVGSGLQEKKVFNGFLNIIQGADARRTHRAPKAARQDGNQEAEVHIATKKNTVGKSSLLFPTVNYIHSYNKKHFQKFIFLRHTKIGCNKKLNKIKQTVQSKSQLLCAVSNQQNIYLHEQKD